MNMRHKILFGALCVTAAFFASCNDEDIVKFPHAVGDEIVFGARAGFENADNSSSRTVYSGETYQASGKTFERIDWVAGDKIQIYCPQANPVKTVNYDIVDNNKSYSNIKKCEDQDRGLQWGSNDVHTFYAMYPFVDNEYIKMDGTIVNGYIPFYQEGDIKLKDDCYVVNHDMTYAYMVAKNSAIPTSEDAVNLTFYPIITALEITLINPVDNQPINLREVIISAAEDDFMIAGDFRCNLLEWNPGNGYPEKANIIDESDFFQYEAIEIPLLTGINKNRPLTLKGGQSVKFTAFLHHHEKIKDLVLSITLGDNKTEIKKKLDQINIEPNTKCIIKGLELNINKK